MRWLHLNNKKTYLAILEFLNLIGKIIKFQKILILEHNWALNYSMVKIFHIRGLDLNNKKPHSEILQFLNLTGKKITKFQNIWIFEHNLAINYSPV